MHPFQLYYINIVTSDSSFLNSMLCLMCINGRLNGDVRSLEIFFCNISLQGLVMEEKQWPMGDGLDRDRQRASSSGSTDQICRSCHSRPS